ncbi:MAG: rhodanese-like domain-containing protein [Planctomycetes bacterium]|nr:rhodanese-like domain-containing protein [Planctomycetota bacterium]
MRLLIPVAVFALIGCGSPVPPDLSKTEQEVRAKYPDVKQLSTADLAAWIADSKRAQPVLLDAREPGEWKVSRLAGARNTPPGTKPDAALAGVPKDAPVVVYCSVGYRSSDFAERAKKAGWTNVANLEGSIFQWANEGRPLVDDKGPATKVHPYDEKWGQMLKPELRAPLK